MRARTGSETVRRRLRAVLLASCVAVSGLAVTGCDGEAGSATPLAATDTSRPDRVALAARVPALPTRLVSAEPEPKIAPEPPGLADNTVPPTRGQSVEAAPLAPTADLPAPAPARPLPQAPRLERELRIAALEATAPVEMAAPVALRLAPLALSAEAGTMVAPMLATAEPDLPDAALAAALPDPAPVPAFEAPAVAAPALGAATLPAAPAPDRRARIAQISDPDRAAYIAQVGAGASGQRLAVRAGDEVLGAVRFQVAGGRVSVHVGQVLDLFEDRMDTARFAALRASPAAREFVSLDQVRKAGIPLEYDAVYDELVLRSTSG